jgi:hypothetical protein
VASTTNEVFEVWIFMREAFTGWQHAKNVMAAGR